LTVIRSHPTAPYGGRRADPVIPVFQPPLIGAADVALCSFQGPRRGSPTSVERSASGISAPTRAPADAGLSKLNSMLDGYDRAARGSQVARSCAERDHPARLGRHARPDRSASPEPRRARM